jgi:hypothetical protein
MQRQFLDFLYGSISALPFSAPADQDEVRGTGEPYGGFVRTLSVKCDGKTQTHVFAKSREEEVSADTQLLVKPSPLGAGKYFQHLPTRDGHASQRTKGKIAHAGQLAAFGLE